LDLEHRNKPRFQLFFWCKESHFANSGVFARDKPSKSSGRQILAIFRFRPALADDLECRAFAAGAFFFLISACLVLTDTDR
jgi:hypothetical protein